MVELSASEIVLEYVVPGLGTIMATIMFLAPFKDLTEAVARGYLGDLNPTPWAFMMGNCFGWVAYSILLQNWFIFWANAPGFMLSIYLNFGAIKLMYQGHHVREIKHAFVEFLRVQEDLEMSKRSTRYSSDDTITDLKAEARPTDWAALVGNLTSRISPAAAAHETLLFVIISIWVACIATICFFPSIDDQKREYIVGCLTNFNLVVFYGAPLSTMYRVIRERDSSSIHIPTMVMNTINSSFWTAYGFALSDPFVYAPNGVGAFLGCLQVLLVGFFPRTIMDAAKMPYESVACRNLNTNSDRDATVDMSRERRSNSEGSRVITSWTHHSSCSTGSASLDFMFDSDSSESASLKDEALPEFCPKNYKPIPHDSIRSETSYIIEYDIEDMEKNLSYRDSAPVWLGGSQQSDSFGDQSGITYHA